MGVEAAETLPGAATETETDGTAPPEGLLPETAHELLEADAAEEVRTAIAEEDLGERSEAGTGREGLPGSCGCCRRGGRTCVSSAS